MKVFDPRILRRYLRYVDDLACFGDDKPALRDWRAAISEFLLGTRLRLNEGKSRIRRLSEGIEFLGFVALPDRLRLSPRGVRRLRRRLRSLRAGLRRGGLDWTEVDRSVRTLAAHLAHGDTWRMQCQALCRTGWALSAQAGPV